MAGRLRKASARRSLPCADAPHRRLPPSPRPRRPPPRRHCRCRASSARAGPAAH